MAYAVNAMIGIDLVVELFFSRRVTSRPSIPGSCEDQVGAERFHQLQRFMPVNRCRDVVAFGLQQKRGEFQVCRVIVNDEDELPAIRLSAVVARLT